MKRRLFLAALSLVAVAFAVWFLWPPDRTPPGYLEIAVGMNPQDVRNTLHAEPVQKSPSEEWYYFDKGVVHVVYNESHLRFKEFTSPPRKTGLLRQVMGWLGLET